jgi:hypothetical protein
MPAAQELLLAASEERKRIAAKSSAPPQTGDEQEADVFLYDAEAPGESPVTGRRSTWSLQAALGGLLLACVLAAAASAVAKGGPPAAWRSNDPAQLRRLDRDDRFVDSRNPSLRQAATQEEGNIADDITAAFSLVQGGSSLDEDDADGTDEAQGDEQRRAPLRRNQPRDERSFDRAFQEAGSAEEGKKDQKAFEELIGDLPI